MAGEQGRCCSSAFVFELLPSSSPAEVGVEMVACRPASRFCTARRGVVMYCRCGNVIKATPEACVWRSAYLPIEGCRSFRRCNARSLETPSSLGASRGPVYRRFIRSWIESRQDEKNSCILVHPSGRRLVCACVYTRKRRRITLVCRRRGEEEARTAIRGGSVFTRITDESCYMEMSCAPDICR